MKYTVITAQVAAVAIAGGGIGLWLSPGRGIQEVTPSHPVVTVQPPTSPCATEGGPGPCYWDATARGNGVGRSFWVTADGTILYDGGEVDEQEPYGGCDEAWQAPKSEGAEWCRDHGLLK